MANPSGDVRLHTLALFKTMTAKENIISFDNLYEGLKKSCRNVRWKDSTVRNESNILKRTVDLKDALDNGSYKILPYQRFTIHEPKERHIVATRVRDRQFQRSLCDNYLYHEITKHFIYDNCACLRGKGVDFALNRMTAHLRQHRQEHGTDGWVLKCDIRHYFPSIRHDVAKQAIRKRVDDEWVCERVEEVIDSFGEVGIGLGSQISQLVALAVLDDLDHFIKERLRVRHYIRYMDDFILIHEDKEYLKYCLHEIGRSLNEIGLSLNDKTKIFPIRQGIRFLQWRFVISESGAIVRKMNRRKVSKQKQRIKKLVAKEREGLIEIGSAQTSLQSWLANAERGNTYNQRKKMKDYYKEVKHGNSTDRT